jgi:hypothetical protein
MSVTEGKHAGNKAIAKTPTTGECARISKIPSAAGKPETADISRMPTTVGMPVSSGTKWMTPIQTAQRMWATAAVLSAIEMP